MAKKTTEKKTRLVNPFHGTMAPPDHPLFKRGFVIGQTNSSNFSPDILGNPSGREPENPGDKDSNDNK